MATRARIITGPRNTSFDHHIQDLIDSEGFGSERQYFGITNPQRAEEVRRRMKRAGQHLGVSVKAYWIECGGCGNGGAGCRFHVCYTAYDPAAARSYKLRQGRQQPR